MLGRATLTIPASPSALALADSVAVGFAHEAGIAGDDVATTIRKAFVKRYGDAGPGFALAASPWDWYRREHFNHELPDGFKPA